MGFSRQQRVYSAKCLHRDGPAGGIDALPRRRRGGRLSAVPLLALLTGISLMFPDDEEEMDGGHHAALRE